MVTTRSQRRLGPPTTCGCLGGEEVEVRLLVEVLHPWHAAYAEWVKEERVHPEEQQEMEMEAL